MSRETDFLLRLASQADKELKTTGVEVHGAAEKFTSQLTSEYTRKGIAGYNNSNSASGEILWGGSDLTEANGIPIPKGAIDNFPISTDIDLYFMNTVSGENSDLRVVEIA